MKALIFDCDGVLADTERDGHRVAFNEAFRRMGLSCEWDPALYGRLLLIAGGKERMRAYFEETGWPAEARDRDLFIKQLHKLKTDLFMEIIAQGRLPLRPGIARLVDEAIAAGMKLAICSTSDARGVTAIAESQLGGRRVSRFSAILAGDVVAKKKPDPAIYLLARDRLAVPAAECVVVEDSRNGLLAAKAAGMKCIITKSSYTLHEEFREADLVVDDLGEPPETHVTVGDLTAIGGQDEGRGPGIPAHS
jgi:HAD superfamily hydrolase (TIGR01509 family)